MTLESLNRIDREDAIRELRKCCGTRVWAETMADARPFPDLRALLAVADRVWDALGPAEWREAFDHHPRIGGMDALREKFASTGSWASEEQRGVASAPEATLRSLSEGNTRYEERFGHIFLVCATGKSADEMLALLESRMGNAPEAELRVAAGEQAKITRIRLEKMIS